MYKLTVKKIGDRFFNDETMIENKEFYCESDAVEYLKNNYGKFREVKMLKGRFFVNSLTSLTADLLVD